MASVLIAGDIHLKDFIFDRLDKVNIDKNPDYVCVLGDLPDDFGEGNNLALYKRTFDRAIRFAHEHKNVIFLMGNHEFSYINNRPTNAYSNIYHEEIKDMILELYSECDHRIAFRCGKIIMSHAGISQEFAENELGYTGLESVDEIVNRTNLLDPDILVTPRSPIWYRILYNADKPMAFEDAGFIQIVGHTAMPGISSVRNVILCDVFSKYPKGNEKFLFIKDADNPMDYSCIDSKEEDDV